MSTVYQALEWITSFLSALWKHFSYNSVCFYSLKVYLFKENSQIFHMPLAIYSVILPFLRTLFHYNYAISYIWLNLYFLIYFFLAAQSAITCPKCTDPYDFTSCTQTQRCHNSHDVSILLVSVLTRSRRYVEQGGQLIECRISIDCNKWK